MILPAKRVICTLRATGLRNRLPVSALSWRPVAEVRDLDLDVVMSVELIGVHNGDALLGPALAEEVPAVAGQLEPAVDRGPGDRAACERKGEVLPMSCPFSAADRPRSGLEGWS